MTTEKRYEMIVDMIREYDNATGSSGLNSLLKNPEQYKKCFCSFYATAAELIIDTRAELDKKAGKGSTLSTVKRILKNAPVHLAGIVTREHDFVVCDGYQLYFLNDDITSLPHIDSNMHFDDIMKDIESICYREIQPPTKAELKRYILEHKENIKLEKNRKEVLPLLLDDISEIAVNPEFIVNALEVLENPKFYISDSRIKPVYVTGDNGRGIFLPINYTKCGRIEKAA